MCIARFWNHQNDKKFGQVLVKLQTLYTERCIWDYTNTWRKKPPPPPPPIFTMLHAYLEYEGIWRAMLFRGHVSSDVLPHLHNKNEYRSQITFHLFPELNLLFKLRICHGLVEKSPDYEAHGFAYAHCTYFLKQNIPPTIDTLPPRWSNWVPSRMKFHEIMLEHLMVVELKPG